MPAENGNRVKIHYKGKFADGKVFDSSEGREPLEFSIGGGQVIPGFEEAVTGMETGEKKTVKIPPEKAYGRHMEELVIKMKKSQFPPNIKPEIGISLHLRHPSGGTLGVVITGIEDDIVILDGNHPLAGKELTFDIELVEILK